MLPVVDEVKQSKSDSTKNKNNKDIPVYIVFDFECTQDNSIQCEAGYQSGQDTLNCVNCKKSNCGTYEHKPNVCVAHKVCSDCFDKELTFKSTYHYCGQHEQVFTGLNTVDKFCKRLFSGENNGATVLCHNFKGYDSFPILQYLFKNAIIPKIIPSGAKTCPLKYGVTEYRFHHNVCSSEILLCRKSSIRYYPYIIFHPMP